MFFVLTTHSICQINQCINVYFALPSKRNRTEIGHYIEDTNLLTNVNNDMLTLTKCDTNKSIALEWFEDNYLLKLTDSNNNTWNTTYKGNKWSISNIENNKWSVLYKNHIPYSIYDYNAIWINNYDYNWYLYKDVNTTYILSEPINNGMKILYENQLYENQLYENQVLWTTDDDNDNVWVGVDSSSWTLTPKDITKSDVKTLTLNDYNAMLTYNDNNKWSLILSSDFLNKDESNSMMMNIFDRSEYKYTIKTITIIEFKDNTNKTYTFTINTNGKYILNNNNTREYTFESSDKEYSFKHSYKNYYIKRTDKGYTLEKTKKGINTVYTLNDVKGEFELEGTTDLTSKYTLKNTDKEYVFGNIEETYNFTLNDDGKTYTLISSAVSYMLDIIEGPYTLEIHTDKNEYIFRSDYKVYSFKINDKSTNIYNLKITKEFSLYKDNYKYNMLWKPTNGDIKELTYEDNKWMYDNNEYTLMTNNKEWTWPLTEQVDRLLIVAEGYEDKFNNVNNWSWIPNDVKTWKLYISNDIWQLTDINKDEEFILNVKDNLYSWKLDNSTSLVCNIISNQDKSTIDDAVWVYTNYDKSMLVCSINTIDKITTTSTKNNSISIGAIVGITIGCSIIAVAIVLVAYYYLYYRSDYVCKDCDVVDDITITTPKFSKPAKTEI